MIGHRSAKLLRESLESLEAHCPRDNWELVIVLNGASPEVTDWAHAWVEAKNRPTRLVEILEARPGAARSEGVPFCRGEIVFFLDDDILVARDVITTALDVFSDPAVLAAGGPNLTPPGSDTWERASGAVMESRIGAGRMSRRYRPTSRVKSVDEHSLILCNLAVRKDALLNARVFPHRHMVSNEENLLLQELSRTGGRLVSAPGLTVFHKRRSTLGGIAQQAAKYGEGRVQNLILLPQTFHVRYLLPSGVLALLAATPALVTWEGAHACIPAALYGGAVFFAAIAASWKKRDWALLGTFPLVCVLVHLSYGWAFIRGSLKWAWQRERLCEALE